MYSLIRVGEDTWYAPTPTNIGIFRYSGREVCMIDAGSRDIAAGVLEQVISHGWELKKLFLTHSHADHVAGAAFLREQTGCEVCAPGVSAAAVEHSFLIPVTLYGGSTTPEMCSRLLTPPPCACSELSGDALPPGLDFERLDGHDMAQAAFRTRDGVWFTADAVVSAADLQKHRISFVYSQEQHRESLARLSGFSGKLFIPAHDVPCEDIAPLVQENLAAMNEVAADIEEMCGTPQTIDDLIAKCLEKYHIRLYLMQYLLVGQTVRSYVTWLLKTGRIEPVYEGTRLLFRRIQQLQSG